MIKNRELKGVVRTFICSAADVIVNMKKLCLPARESSKATLNGRQRKQPRQDKSEAIQ